MSFKITYGVFGLIEYETSVTIAGKECVCSFTGGSITANGVTPATFTTSSEVVQYALQKSPRYKAGRIKIVRKEALNAETKPAPKPAAEPAATEKEAGSEPAEAAAEPTAAEPTVVKVTCLQDAVTYLKENFGIKGKSITTLDAVKSAAATNGVTFDGI